MRTGDALRVRRIAAGLSLATVAHAWGTSRAWVCKVEKGKGTATVPQLRAFALLVGCEARPLLRLRSMERGLAEVEILCIPTAAAEILLAIQAAGPLMTDTDLGKLMADLGWYPAVGTPTLGG